MGVDNDKLADLITTTLKDLPKGQFEVMWDSQNYEFCRIYQKNRRQIDGGTSIQRNVILDRNGRARYRRLYDTDNPVVDNNQHTIDVPWTQIGTDYSWDVVEILRNKNSEKGFINLMESRRTERMWDLAELIEERGWATPTSATDKLYPYGIPYYINFLDDGSETGGFHAKTIRYQNGTTGTICAGIDASAESKWRNYADVYTKVDNTLLRKLRQAVRRTRFRPAPFVPQPGNDGPGNPIKMYANDATVTELEDLADKRDDNNSPKDLAGKMLHDYDGTVMFNRMPVQYVPHLDGFTVTDGGSNDFEPDPIYCVDWTKLQPVVQDGYWMEEGKPMTDRGQHTTFTVYLDGSHNNLCTNRRTAGFVLHKKIPAS
jgi:hypothetical protein